MNASCMVCGNQIPLRHGRLIEHYKSAVIRTDIYDDRLCDGSGMKA
jgi:hypothetical protein